MKEQKIVGLQDAMFEADKRIFKAYKALVKAYEDGALREKILSGNDQFEPNTSIIVDYIYVDFDGTTKKTEDPVVRIMAYVEYWPKESDCMFNAPVFNGFQEVKKSRQRTIEGIEDYFEELNKDVESIEESVVVTKDVAFFDKKLAEELMAISIDLPSYD